MKDTVIKETGNSRFLRSSVSEDITFGEFIALLRAGQLPIDLAGINAEGIDTLGTALNKANLLNSGTETFLFGTDEDRNVNDAIAGLVPWKLIGKIDNTVGYSGTWTAPDLFGDGRPYTLGIYMIGAGGSGGAGASGETSNEGYSSSPASSGGASGYGRNVIIENVIPGTVFNWVVGKGGAAVTASASADGRSSANGKTGGTTSFGEETALGGTGGNGYASWGYGSVHTASGVLGGQSSDDTDTNYTGDRKLYGCAPTNNAKTPSQLVREGQNAFDPFMITLAAGGFAYYSNNSQTVVALPDGTKGGNGKASTSNATAGSATGYGNGGGGASSYPNATAARTAKSGAGSDGVIYIYAKESPT